MKLSYVIVFTFLVLLVSGCFAPVGSIDVQNNVQNMMNDAYKQAYAQLSEPELSENMIIENTTVVTQTASYNGTSLGTTNVTTYCILDYNGTEYVRSVADYYPADKSDYGLIIQTPLIPTSELQSSTNDNTVNPDTTVVYNPVRYVWDGNITFISTQSSPQYVKYDHPDNTQYPNATYDWILPDETGVTILYGSDGIYVVHVPKHTIDEAKTDGEWGGGMTGLLIGLITSLCLLPDPTLISKASAAILLIVSALIAGLGLTFGYWLDTVLRTELSDGWMFIGGFGSWWVFSWFWLSFGSWRDWHWPIIFVSPGWDDPYNGNVDPWTWYDPYDTTTCWKPMTCWYCYSEDKGVYVEWKPIASSQLPSSDSTDYGSTGDIGLGR